MTVKEEEEQPVPESITTAESTTRRQSDLTAVSADDSSNENPFMTLVDAAASLLETKTPAAKKAVSPVQEEDPSTPSADNPKAEPGGIVPKEGAAARRGSNVIPGTKDDLVGDASQKKMSFAEQLMDILDSGEHEDVLQWMPDGKAFTIVNHKKFVLEKMPKLFNIRNMSSFVRKLGRWGFARAHEKETRNSDIFKHEHFLRGEKDLCRRKVKCVGRTATAVPVVVPPQGLSLNVNRSTVIPFSRPAGLTSTKPLTLTKVSPGSDVSASAAAIYRQQQQQAALLDPRFSATDQQALLEHRRSLGIDPRLLLQRQAEIERRLNSKVSVKQRLQEHRALERRIEQEEQRAAKRRFKDLESLAVEERLLQLQQARGISSPSRLSSQDMSTALDRMCSEQSFSPLEPSLRRQAAIRALLEEEQAAYEARRSMMMQQQQQQQGQSRYRPGAANAPPSASWTTGSSSFPYLR